MGARFPSLTFTNFHRLSASDPLRTFVLAWPWKALKHKLNI